MKPSWADSTSTFLAEQVDAFRRRHHSTVVFRDSAFADDVAKSNLIAILEQHGLEDVRSL